MFNDVDMDLLSSEIANNNAVLFVGAGFSKNAIPKNEYITTQFMDWAEFIFLLGKKVWPEINDEVKLKDKCTDFLYVVQLFKDRFGEDEFYKMVKLSIPTNDYIPSNIHKKLLGIPWTDIITTNMDDLIEKTFESINLPYDLIIDDEQISINSSPYPKIIKMHGTLERPNTIVFSEEDYRLYEIKHPLIVVKIKQIFAEKTVFFIGFSLTDPNFKKIFLWVNDILKKYQKKAYAFIPNADKNEIEYWRDRNIVIFSNNEHEHDVTEKIDTFISKLQNGINKYNYRNFNDARKYIFKGLDYKEFIAKKNQEIDFYLENSKRDDGFKAADVIVNNIYKYLKVSEDLGVYHKYSNDVLQELLLSNNIMKPRTYNLPELIFQEFNTFSSNADICYKLVYILKRYINTYQTTKITLQEPISSYKNCTDSFPIPKQYDLYEILNTDCNIDSKTKQFLIYSRLKELYFKERKYEDSIKFIEQNGTKVDNLYYQDEIKYIELLCYKHLSEYKKILEFLREDSFKQENSLNSLRLGYLYYLVNDFINMKRNYERALNNNEKNVSNSLTAIYNLRVLSLSSWYYKNTSYRDFLGNKEEQLRYRMSFNTKGASIFNIKETLSKLEADITQRLVEDTIDYKGATEVFKEFVRISEYYGVPDIFISQNFCFEILFSYLKRELPVKQYIDSFFSFGVNIKNAEFTDRVIEYGKINEYLYEVLNKKVEKNIEFLLQIKIDREFVCFSFPIRVLDESIKYLIDVVSVFNDQEMITIADNMFKAINLNLPQINNTIVENAVKLITKIINLLTPQQSVKLVNRYLQLVIDNNLNWLLRLDGIHPKKWDANILSEFDYRLLIDLLHKLETPNVSGVSSYFGFIVNINAIAPIPKRYKDELYENLLKLQQYSNEYTYLLLLKDIGGNDDKMKSLISNVYENYVKFTNDNLTNKSYVMTEGEQYYIFADFIEYLEENKQKNIIELGTKDISKLEELDKYEDFPFPNREALKEAVQYYLIKYSLKNNEFTQLHGFVSKYTLYLYPSSIKILRNLFEQKPEMVSELFNLFLNKLKSNIKEEKITTLINLNRFYYYSTRIMTQESNIIEVIKYHLFQTDKDILAWTISILSTIIKNNHEWAQNNASNIVDVVLTNDVLSVDSENYLVALACLLNNSYDFCEGETKKKIAGALDTLRNINSARINRELTNNIITVQE